MGATESRLLRDLQEENREVWQRYRKLQSDIIEAFNRHDWRLVGRIAHEQRKLQELERRRWRNH